MTVTVTARRSPAGSLCSGQTTWPRSATGTGTPLSVVAVTREICPAKELERDARQALPVRAQARTRPVEVREARGDSQGERDGDVR